MLIPVLVIEFIDIRFVIYFEVHNELFILFKELTYMGIKSSDINAIFKFINSEYSPEYIDFKSLYQSLK